jgi:hypothetical protein
LEWDFVSSVKLGNWGRLRVIPKRRACVLGLIAALLGGLAERGYAQGGGPEKIPPPAAQGETFLPAHVLSPPGVMGADGPVTMQLDPQTKFPPGGPPESLFSPFEFFARTGAALNTGRGPLSDVLRTGVGVEAGVRSFHFNESRSAAWYGDLGIGYLYNDSSDSTVGLPAFRLGQTLLLPSITTLGLRELHRTNARLALGREFYFHSRFVEGLSFSLGGDIGGVWGRTTIKTIVLDREIPDEEPGDNVLGGPKDNHSGDVNKGFFFGGNLNMIMAKCRYDFIVGTRIEWERDYFKVVNNDSGSSQLKLYLEVGWRY